MDERSEMCLQLFRFGGHPHRLVLMIGRMRMCAHKGCTSPVIGLYDRHFGCIRCNFDLCTTCVQLAVPDDLAVPLQEHSRIDPYVFHRNPLTGQYPTGTYTGARQATEEEKGEVALCTALTNAMRRTVAPANDPDGRI